MERVITRLRTPGVVAVVALVLVGALVATFAPEFGEASSHREAPLTAAQPQIDNTDVYAFVSPDDPNTVTFISNWIPFEEPAGGPNFYPFGTGVRYDIRIDSDGDARPDVTYRWTFHDRYRTKDTFLTATGPVTSLDDPDLNFRQTYDLQRISRGETRTLVDNGVAAPSDMGQSFMPDYSSLREEAIATFDEGSSQTLAGQADDPFFLDLRVFDLLYGGPGFPESGDDTLAGFNVNTLVLQVPKKEVEPADGDGIIGVWSTASRASEDVLENGNPNGDRFVQVSRLGNPLVNEVVIPLKDKDRFNASRPRNDLANFGAYITNPELPQLIEAIFGITAPATPREDLVAVFATGVEGLNQPDEVVPSEMLRLNLNIDPCLPDSGCSFSRLGVIGGDNAGFPNGRRLQDDVLDIALQVLEGELLDNPNDLGDGVDTNDKSFEATFPYIALPHRGSDPNPHD